MRRVLPPARVSVCPRCGGYIPNNDHPGAYPGATSRTDNKTEICSPCGTTEAMEDFLGAGVKSQELWAANIGKEFEADIREMRSAEVKW